MLFEVKTVLLDIDDGNRDKIQKHGLTIEQIKKFFQSNPSYTKDEAHSSDEEQRYLAFGPFEDTFMFVAFTHRKIKKKIYYRPISARLAKTKEIRRLYENFKK